MPQDCEDNGMFDKKLKVIEQYLSSYASKNLHDVIKNRYFKVDVNTIIKDDSFLSVWPDFLKDLSDIPQTVIGLFGLTMDRITRQNILCSSEECPEDRDTVSKLNKKINPRFIGLRNFLHFQDLKSHKYGKFVTLMGTVVRVSDEKPMCTCMAFECYKCGTIQTIHQEKGCFSTPGKCKGSNCYSTKHKPLLQSPNTLTIPWKTIRLQELNGNENEGGRVPRTVESELTNELTESCMPGDVVIISGIITVNNITERKPSFGKETCAYVVQLSANSVTCVKGKNTDCVDIAAESLQFNPEDLTNIQKIHSERNLFRLIVASLCPRIYGHELIKAGLVLCLFGGRVKSQSKDKDCDFFIRENSHILIVGDPGLGKSQMLLASSSVSPRGVYVCGNSTTSSGLTATIVKEGGGESSLEAGALVLSDQGHCCIDEFDKMSNQHAALLEAMEQQTISMAKSGVVCTLPARASIIAAANPSGGHYNKAKTVSENLKINGSLLSRFDLVFIVQDIPDGEIDNKMTAHVMAYQKKKKHANENASVSPFFLTSILSGSADRSSLLQKLQFGAHEKPNLIPPSLLQKYISYARKFSQPKLMPDVSKILQEFYLEMRKQHKLSCSTPITTRQLESMIRLTEARAKVELRDYCTISDAENVIEIMKYSMQDTFSDEHGNIDFDRSIHGSGMSKSSQAKKFIQILTKAAVVKGDDCFTTHEMCELAKKSKLNAEAFLDIIDALNNQGFLLKKGYQLYQIQTL
ncbi:DNA helicase MCM8-like [Uloborus diversus]|uniref:DNA helicase MCM8-like n=1 Tax=Uloborus diversus TaxID=327109 RepID=UPI00240A202F|nr:DNA helicase MCM8-like [Uloborus diversus]